MKTFKEYLNEASKDFTLKKMSKMQQTNLNFGPLSDGTGPFYIVFPKIKLSAGEVPFNIRGAIDVKLLLCYGNDNDGIDNLVIKPSNDYDTEARLEARNAPVDLKEAEEIIKIIEKTWDHIGFDPTVRNIDGLYKSILKNIERDSRNKLMYIK